jgi:hypothetical protein
MQVSHDLSIAPVEQVWSCALAGENGRGQEET